MPERSHLLDGPTIPLIDPSLLDVEIIVPSQLVEVLQFNRKLIPKYVPAIREAVQQSFNHAETRLKGEVTRREVQLRVNMCQEALKMMYYEEKMLLTQAFDILPGVLIDAIRAGMGVDIIAETRRQGNWSVDAPAEEVVLTGNINDEE